MKNCKGFIFICGYTKGVLRVSLCFEICVLVLSLDDGGSTWFLATFHHQDL